MDCRQDLEFNDDSCRIEEKAKESILLMKKKMLRSHDLILQYNNKLKECERLKGDLCIAQEVAIKLKQENNVNLAKVVKLELQSSEYKKCQQDLERRIADKDILIASDKCHLQQLVCKVEDIEDKHSEKLMEVELEKSSLEVKLKNLEQELKTLRRSHIAEVNKLEKAINALPPKAKRGTIKVVKETKDIGVNTVEEAQPVKPIKPATAHKSVLTSEFYHITNNPYPIFCEKCESSVEPSVEKICKIMTTHPPLLTEMLSPTRRHEIPRVNVSRSCQDSRASDSNNLNFGHKHSYRNDSDPKEMNLNEFNRVDPISKNFISPIEPMIPNYQQINVAGPMDTTVIPEIESLRRKVKTLERKIKKRERQRSSDAQSTTGCCGQPRSVNCCSHGQSHANTVPNVFNNVQSDMMTEFWKRLMMFKNEPAPNHDSSRKPKKQTKLKLRRLKREKMKKTKKMKNCGSTSWEIESEDCGTEKNVDNSETGNSHILRIKSSDDRIVELTGKGAQIENASNHASPVKVPDKPDDNGRINVSLISDCDDVKMEVESLKHKVVENFDQTSNSELPIIQTRDHSNGVTIRTSSDGDIANFYQNSESAYFSQNSAVNESASVSHDADLQTNSLNSNFKSALPIDETVLNLKTDSRNSDFPVTSHNSPGDKSVSVDSDTDLSDAPADEHFDADSRHQSRARKRKRSSSPKATKRTTRSNLFGKIRALKKNSVMGVVKTSRTNCHETRNRRKLINNRETEDHGVETEEADRASSISENGSAPRVPAKKQRIAHVPKNENTPEEQENPHKTKLRQVAKQICQNTGKKSTRCPKATTRRSILNETKSEEENMKSEDQSSTLEIVRSSLPVGAMEICRRERTRAKRNFTIDSPLPFNQSANGNLDDPSLPKFSSTSSSTESPISPPIIDVPVEIDESPQKQEKEVSEDDPSDENNQKSPNVTENISKSIGTKLTESLETSDADRSEISELDNRRTSKMQRTNVSPLLEILDATSEPGTPEAVEKLEISKISSAGSDQIAEDPKFELDGSEVCSTPRETSELAASLVLPTGTGETDSPASPASSCSLEKFQMTPEKIAVSPIQSPLYSNVKWIEPPTSSHPESVDAKTSTIDADSLDFTDPTASSEDFTDLRKSILFAKLTEAPSSSGVPAKNFRSPARIPDEVARTGDDASRKFSTHQLPALPAAQPTSHTKNRRQRSSMYDNALLPIPAVASSDSHPKDRLQRSSIYDNVLLPISIEETSSSLVPDGFTTRPMVTQGQTIYDRTEGEISANATTSHSASTSSNNCAEEQTNVPRICEKVEQVSSLSRSTNESGRCPVVYDTNADYGIDSESDSKIVSSPRFFVDNSVDMKKKKATKKPSDDHPEARNVVKELRSRQVLSGPATAANQRNSLTMKNSNEGTIDRTSYPRGIPSPRTLLCRHLGEQKKKSRVMKFRRTGATKLHEAAEKIVKAELDKLVESEEWTSELHQSVIARLGEIHSQRTVAKSIVDLLVERAALREQLDRTYTPPAPVMTRTQQRISTLLNCLERDGIMPGVSKLVQDGIEYTLFRLGAAPQIEVIEGLTRIFTAMSRIRKDRERVRIFCYDSFYCINWKAFAAIHVVLSVWPEAFPMHGSYEDELPNCIAHLIKMGQGAKDPAPKALGLKRMITDYYNYPQFQAPSRVVMTGLVQALQKNYTGDLEAAILLLAKKEGPDWAHDNIINGGLMKIIDDSNYPSSFDALSLLGFILRVFPLADTMGVVEKMGEQLYKIIESEEASPDQQEGVVSALLSLSRHVIHFDKIADIILNWKPRQTLRIRTKEQLNGFFRFRSPTWWNQRHHLKVKQNNTVSDENK